MSSDESYGKLMMISQHYFKLSPGASRQQAITWTKCLPGFMSPYGVTQPWRVNMMVSMSYQEVGVTKIKVCISFAIWNIIYLCSTEHTMMHYKNSTEERLTHWGRDKIAAISQATFSKAFAWTKMYEFSLKISLKFVPEARINNNTALVQIMAWRRPSASHYFDQWWFILMTNICITRPNWVNKNPFHIFFCQRLKGQETNTGFMGLKSIR